MGRGKGHIPIRTCISCMSKRNRGDLIRLAVDSRGQVVIDNRGNMQGRGAYVCNSESCFERLAKNKRLNRIFKNENKLIVKEFPF